MFGGISKEFAKRIAEAVRWVESQRVVDSRGRGNRVRRGRGDGGIIRMKLQGTLSYGGSQTATYTYQDKTTGAWTTSTETDDEETVYDALLKSGQSLATDTYVLCYRDHRSGLLNVVNSDNCAS